jgi:hypothetical protein
MLTGASRAPRQTILVTGGAGYIGSHACVMDPAEGHVAALVSPALQPLQRHPCKFLTGKWIVPNGGTSPRRRGCQMVAEPTNQSAHRSGRYLAGIVGGLEPPTSCSAVSCSQGLLRFGARPSGTLMCAMTPISALRRSPLPAADASGFDQDAFRRPERCTRRLCRRPSLPRLMSSVLSKVSKRSIVGVRLCSTGRGPRHRGMPSAIPAERSRKAVGRRSHD